MRNLISSLSRTPDLRHGDCSSKMLAVYTRVGFPLARQRILFVSTTPTLPSSAVIHIRCYASKSRKHSSKDQSKTTKAKLKSSKFDGEKHGTVSTDQLLPGSQLRISESALGEFQKCEEKMVAAVEWYRKEVSKMETRASGRVTPEILAPVSVKIPWRGPNGVKIEEVATVGVKDGSVLMVTVFENSVGVLVLGEVRLTGGLLVVPPSCRNRSVRSQDSRRGSTARRRIHHPDTDPKVSGQLSLPLTADACVRFSGQP